MGSSGSTIALAALVVGLAACGRTGGGEKSVPRQVVPASVESVGIPDELSGFGNLVFKRKVELTSPRSGLVASLVHREGERVRAGMVLVRLENPLLHLALSQSRTAVAEAEAALSLARSRKKEGEWEAEARILSIARSEAELELENLELGEAERKARDQETLFLAGGLTEEEIRSTRFSLETAQRKYLIARRALEIERVGLRPGDLGARERAAETAPGTPTSQLVEHLTASLQAELEAASARLEAAQRAEEAASLALRELTVLSPVSGLVGALHAEEGERVEAEAPLVSLIEEGNLLALINLSERDVSRVKQGQKALVTVEAAGKTYPGFVETVSPLADTKSASFAVRIVLAGGGEELRPGMFSRVSIVLGPERRVLLVPETSLVGASGGEAKVYSVSGGLVRLRKVVIGNSLSGGREILAGLELGEVVIDRPDSALEEGDRVQISS